MNNPTMPGWYPDTQVPGQSRYWDGNAWTEHTAPTAPNLNQSIAFQGGAPAPQKNWFRRHPVLTGVLALFVVGTIASAAGGSEGDNDEPSKAAPALSQEKAATSDNGKGASPAKKAADEPAPEPKSDAVRVQAGLMLEEFEGNEAAADAKYKGKDLIVTGKVEKVDTEFFDDNEYVIQLSGGGSFVVWTVNCNDVSADAAATIKPSSTVTVQGEFDDGGDLGVEIKDCELV